MSEEILKEYVCLNPFKYLDAQDNTLYMCCPSWCPSNLLKEQRSFYDINEAWKEDVATDIRKSVYDGSYRHCNKKICPELSQLINTGIPTARFMHKSVFDKVYNINSIEDVEKFNGLPTEMLFGFDRSCNLKCPSCRVDLVTNDDVESDAYKNKLHLLKSIETHFGKSLESLLITGSGDPFYSKIYRDYLINFDSTKYPNLKSIHIVTNGQLLTEKMWQSLKSKPFIKFIEISLDAGSKDTYEKITRLNGDWDKLLDNIKFLSTQSEISKMFFSIVVSKYNYKEMYDAYKIIEDIFKNSKIKFDLNYRQIVYWSSSAYSIQDLNKISIFDPIHPEFKDFITELNKIRSLPNATHNFHHLQKFYI